MSLNFAPSRSGFQKVFGINSRLLQDGPKCTFGHIAGMVWNCSVLIRLWVEPDFVAASGLAVKLKAAGFQFPNDFTIAEPGEPAHFRQQPR